MRLFSVRCARARNIMFLFINLIDTFENFNGVLPTLPDLEPRQSTCYTKGCQLKFGNNCPGLLVDVKMTDIDF